MTTIYYVTTPDNAEAIMAEGFEDRSAWGFGPGCVVTGTFFCGRPAIDLHGASNTWSRTVLVAEVPDGDLAPYHVPEHNPAPMWIVPAAVINHYPVALGEVIEESARGRSGNSVANSHQRTNNNALTCTDAVSEGGLEPPCP
jgi:hypothetical protein